MKRTTIARLLTSLLALSLYSIPAHAALRTADTSGYWTNTTTWNGGIVPTNGDSAAISVGITVTADVSTASLSLLTNSGTLVFDGWTTIITAQTVYVSGTITHHVNTDTTGTPGNYGDWTPDNRIYIVCSNLTVHTNGQINVDEKGYPARINGTGYGPGGGGKTDWAGGGGYGGPGLSGNTGAGGSSYGSPTMPTDPGSSGGSAAPYTVLSGAGGGVIRIDASGAVVVDGIVSANGGEPPVSPNNTCGAGSGGSIYITCNTFEGGGTVAAIGGDGDPFSGLGRGGSGSGGRIAIIYDAIAQGGATTPTIPFNARGGRGGPIPYQLAHPGSLYLTDVSFYPTQHMNRAFALFTQLSTNWVSDHVTVDGAWVIFPTNFPMLITNAVTVTGGDGKFELPAPAYLTCDRLTVTNSGRLYLYSGATNGAPDYGGLISVSGRFDIAASSTLYPYCHPSNGGALKFVVGDLALASGGSIDAIGAGYYGYYASKVGWGPGGAGASDVGAGAGHGGLGGRSQRMNAFEGGTYDSSNAPIQPGSCGGYGWPSDGSISVGGGVVRIEAAGTMRLDGNILTRGGETAGSSASGGGSGGSIYLRCETFEGSGVLNADGGRGGSWNGYDTGGGGGGRIAVWRSFYSDWLGSASVTYADGYWHTNGVGTIVWGYVIPERPGISNMPPSSVQVNAASLDGYLFTTGKYDTAVEVYWGTTDCGTNASAWGKTNDFGTGQTVGSLSTNVTMSGGVMMQYYRYRASSAGGEFWADYTESFLPGEISVTSTAATAYEDGIKPGTVTVSRASSATNGDLTVYYTVTGSAEPGTDFDALSSNVIISAGSSNAVIVIQPIWDALPEGDETVKITVTTARYAVASIYTAVVTIVDFFVPAGYNTNITSGAWMDVNTWSLSRPPIEDDHVIIATDVVVDIMSPAFSSLTVNAGVTLTFDGEDTVVTAQTVMVYGTLTHDTNSDISAPWIIDGSVFIVCGDFTLATGAVIDVDEKGYQAGIAISDGRGPGGSVGVTWAYGAGHGGYGGPHGNGIFIIDTGNGQTYGSASAPIWPGSSGAAGNTVGTRGVDGGGLVRIHATNSVTINGTITADGGSFVAASKIIGGGSGGSIYITCKTIEGAAAMTATGGDGSPWNGTDHGGGGGGGRIAILYDTVAQAGVTTPTFTFDVAGGRGGDNPFPQTQPGTLYLSGTNFYNPTVFTNSVRPIIAGRTTWSPASLTVSNAWVEFSETNIQVSGSVVIDGALNGRVHVSPSQLFCANLTLRDGAELYIQSLSTNAVQPEYGTFVDVSGTLLIESNCTLYPISDETNGGSVFFDVGNLTVETGASIDADSYGFRGWLGDKTGLGYGGGPAGDNGSGGGHGGLGGDNYRTGVYRGQSYGDSNAPVHAGSAGGNGAAYTGGGHGGGVVRINARGRITVDGSITVNGKDPIEGNGYNGYAAGGGSGGSIYITTWRFMGDGSLLANGGDSGSHMGGTGPGGGAGGRIAVWRVNSGTCTAQVNGGSGFEAGGTGTIVWGQIAPAGTIFLVR